jgi:dipeptidase
VHSEQNHTMLTRIFSILFWFNPSGSDSESDYQNLEFIADSETLLKISDKKPIKSRFKITAHENYVALSNHFLSIINQKRIVMLNKNRANGFMEVRPCSSGFIRLYAVSSKCRGAGKS